MSMAMKYRLKQRMAKGGACRDCDEGVCMAHGGKVDSPSDVKRKKHEETTRNTNPNPAKMPTDPIVIGYDRHGPIHQHKTFKYTDPNDYAEGGDVYDDMGDDGKVSEGMAMLADGDMISRIMKKRMAKGGDVEDVDGIVADFEPAEYDQMEKEPAEKFSYTGKNSGDEEGNEALDEEDRDMVSRIMKSRGKKDRLPRPA